MKLFKILKITLATAFLFMSKTVYGANIGLDPSRQVGGVEVKKYLSPGGTGTLLGNLVRNTMILLFTVGALGFTIMIIWGGVSWILSGGDKEKVAGARKRITTAIIGLVILSLTFVIMVIVGQVTGIGSLTTGKFNVPGLLDNR
jgi:hypothetical protein